ncbi:hypothetical protein KUCAC02_023166 [Chaenocephalus aceratus]|uniref:Uncharacterized protein n=1 Tax=Chaenocephalus aceratus TaxID=36190 RepID=A0ACB9XR83_CHAAC|nr:hypothetical protein KUCAC02_023166 [Chaenocephalus aceratus]
MRRNRLGKEDWINIKWQPGKITHTFQKDATSCGAFVMQVPGGGSWRPHYLPRLGGHKTWRSVSKNIDTLSDSEVMQVEKKWHILFTIFFLLITSGQCMDSKVVKQKERRTLLDLILQVIRESQQRDKTVSRRCSSGLFTSAQDMKSTSREKPFYVHRLDNSRLIGPNIMEEGSLCCQGSAFKSTAVI